MNRIQYASNYSLQNNLNSQRFLRPLKNINYAEEEENFDDIKDPDYNPEEEEEEEEEEDDEDDDYEPEYTHNIIKNNVYDEDILVGGIMNEDSDDDSDYTPSVHDSDEDEDDEDEDYEIEKEYHNKNMVNICKRRFENGKVIYRWVKMTQDEAEKDEDPDYEVEEI